MIVDRGCCIDGVLGIGKRSEAKGVLSSSNR